MRAGRPCAAPCSGGAASEKENDMEGIGGMMLPKMKISLFPAVASLSLAAAMVCAAVPVWETDLGQALKKASQSGRPVLVDFTGSDWCPACIHICTILPPIRLEISKYVSDCYVMERHFPKALEYLEKARDADPESALGRKLGPWIDQMKKHMDEWK